MELIHRVRVPAVLRRDTVDEVLDALGKSARIVVLQGEEGRFCEGMDLQGDGDLAPFAELLSAFDARSGPVVAIVDGPALGGGCALAAAADLVVATPRATFGLPEVLWGLIPALAFPVVARRVGVARARLLALGIAALEAQEALRWGLADVVAEDPWEALAPWTRRLLRAEPAAQAHARALSTLLGPGYAEAATERFRTLSASHRAPWEEP